MAFPKVLMIPVLLVTSACGQASAATIDPSQDLDCSVLSVFMKELGTKVDADPKQKRALAVVHKWYVERTQPTFQELGEEAFRAKISPIYEAAKRETIRTATEKHMICAKRAVDEGLR
jgi:hypothetical protein